MYTYSSKTDVVTYERNLTIARVVLLCTLIAFAQGAFAEGGDVPGVGILDWIIEAMQGKLARGAAIIAIIATGYMAIVGKLAMRTGVMICAGIILIFGAKPLGDALIASLSLGT